MRSELYVNMSLISIIFTPLFQWIDPSRNSYIIPLPSGLCLAILCRYLSHTSQSIGNVGIAIMHITPPLVFLRCHSELLWHQVVCCCDRQCETVRVLSCLSHHLQFCCVWP